MEVIKYKNDKAVFNVAKDTIGQSTGLVDQHGKYIYIYIYIYIYEGDIVHITGGLYIILTDDYKTTVKDIRKFYHEITQTQVIQSEMEVLGNIYENPKLIKNEVIQCD